MIEFNLEGWDKFWADGQELVKEAFLELGEPIPFSFDVSSFRDLYTSGSMVILTARDNGNMIGYLVMIVRWHFHSQDRKAAWEEGLYLKPEFRVGSTGKWMIQLMEKTLKGLGVKHVYFTSRERFPRLTNLYRHLGMSKMGEIYTKELL